MTNDFIYLSRYQNLHMDRVNNNSMSTTEISIETNFDYNQPPVLIHRYRHGYSYRPQFWGLWDIQLNSDFGGIYIRMYGLPAYMTGLGPSADFHYEVDDEYVNIYFSYSDPRPGTPARLDTSGIKATFTGYIFANDLNEQDYTN